MKKKKKKAVDQSFEKYFPSSSSSSGKSRSRVFGNNILLAKISRGGTDDPSGVDLSGEIEELVRESGIGVGWREVRSVVVFGGGFETKRMVMSQFTEEKFGQVFNFVHECSLSSSYKPSYSICVTRRGVGGLEMEMNVVNGFQILEYPFETIVNSFLIKSFFYCPKKTLVKNYFTKNYFSKNSVMNDLEEDEKKFYDFLRLLTRVLGLSSSEVTQFLKWISYFLIFYENNASNSLNSSQIASVTNVLRKNCTFYTSFETRKLIQKETNLRIHACLIYEYLLQWIVLKVNALFKRECNNKYLEGIMKFRKIVVMPEIPLPKKTTRKGGRSKATALKFTDFCYNMMNEHMYYLAVKKVREMATPQNVKQCCNNIMFFVKFSKERFFLLKNIVNFVQKTKTGKIISSKSATGETKVLIRLRHVFGDVYYDLKDFLFSRKKLYLVNQVLNCLSRVFSGLGGKNMNPLFVFVEDSAQKLKNNGFISQFLNTRKSIDDKKERVSKTTIYNSILLVQNVIRTNFAEKKYQLMYELERERKLYHLKRRFGALKIQKWWKKWKTIYHEKKKKKMEEKKAVALNIIKYNVKRYLEKRKEKRNKAATVIQYHCKKYFDRKVKEWINGMLKDAVGTIEEKFLDFQKKEVFKKEIKTLV